MIGPGCKHSRGQLRLDEETDTVVALSNTYYKVSGIFHDGETSGFIITDNKLVWKGASGTCFLFTGVSDVQVNKACQINYALFKNDTLVEQAQTPHDFVSPAKTANIAITALVKLNQDDYVDVHVKSDTVDTVVTVQTLNITLWS